MALPSVPAPGGTPKSVPPSAATLRSVIDARVAEGKRMSIEEAIAVVVPVCLDLQERHARGEKLYVHPSAIAPAADGLAKVNPRLSVVPTNAKDKHCLAPELMRTLEPGDECASVYSVGAILYEMVTGRHVGPGMKRPREIDPGLPEALEVLIGKAMIGDRSHRPADLGALASAMYHVAPQKSIHPPEISEARLDASAELDVDVKFSMLPPHSAAHGSEQSGVNGIPRSPQAPRYDTNDPYGAPVIDRTNVPAPGSSRRLVDDPTARLATLKARLEADPRPRYVVIKDMMDHGPFTAVELLQQIASNAFVGDHGLRDEISGQQMPISDWEEFAPFVHQTNLVREKKAEERAVVRAADADKKRGVAKSILAVCCILAVGVVLTGWFLKKRGQHNDDVIVAGDRMGSIEVNGDVKGKSGKGGRGGPGGHGGSGGGGFSGGTSFESVLDGNNEQIVMGQSQDTPDLTNAELAAPLRHMSLCGAPDDMHVTIRVAVKMGRAVGVTVSTNPPNPAINACIDRSVRGLGWRPSPKTDFVTTNY